MNTNSTKIIYFVWSNFDIGKTYYLIFFSLLHQFCSWYKDIVAKFKFCKKIRCYKNICDSAITHICMYIHLIKTKLRLTYLGTYLCSLLSVSRLRNHANVGNIFRFDTTTTLWFMRTRVSINHVLSIEKRPIFARRIFVWFSPTIYWTTMTEHFLSEFLLWWEFTESVDIIDIWWN